MKRRKNLTMLISFCVGAVLFVSTAFADVVSKTGYDQLKDAIKKTVASIAEEYDSFTAEMGLSVKDNDKVLISNSAITKYDFANNKMEELSTTEVGGVLKDGFFRYSDSWSTIYHNYNRETYYLYEKEVEDKDVPAFENFFEDEEFEYIERIFDALIGNLKEYVIVAENSDGTKEFSGELSDAQIPALVNAVMAYAAKKTVFDSPSGQNEFDIPYLKNDVFVKEVRGRANVNGDGIVENLFGEIVISGSEENGTKHDLKVELVLKVYNINSTEIVKPDLTGKQVEKNIEHNKGFNYVQLEKYLGKWKNDIVIEENDRFVKVGERIIEITGFDDDYVYGTYNEIYKENYAHYYNESSSYSLKADISDENKDYLEATDASGKVIDGYMYLNMGRVEFYNPTDRYIEDGILFNSTFFKDFDE